MIAQFLLVETLFGEHNSAEANFWWFFFLMVLLFFSYLYFKEKNFWLSLLSNIGCAFTIFLYFTDTILDHYWFLEDAEPLEWIGFVILIIIFLAACFAMAKSHIFMIKHIVDAPVYSIISLVIGLIWAFTWFFAVGSLMSDHAGAALLALLASISTGSAAKVPTIYVKGEGFVEVPGYDGGDTASSEYDNEYRRDKYGDWHRHRD